ncbi:hypothetical protein [Paludibacterium paludis]|uniref:DUF1795 domain-containing protein n=1 Tax=Paludibacterium paludis TaxID=1225769 RepID=A0A918P5L4_9NEIS|nr:hypothetical protein [Paludibacterium paludis]GGY26419.1 hypothetical protein GCM10011289_32430 [Paludibacterium paludis]
MSRFSGCVRCAIGLAWILASAGALAGSYQDNKDPVRFSVPAGWRVRAESVDGVRQLRVIPPKADMRERAAIDVSVRVRRLGRRQSLESIARDYRKPFNDREAASVRFDPAAGRLLLDYREGRFVSGRLWIVRRNLHVFLRLDKKRVIEAKCAANASEYKAWRRQLETVCLSVAAVRKAGAR